MSPLILSLLLAAQAAGPARIQQTAAPAASAQEPIVSADTAAAAPGRHSRRRRSRHRTPSASPSAAAPRATPTPTPVAPPSVAPQAVAGPTQAALNEQLAQAEARYRSALATTPGIAAYHESLALVLERQGRLPEALASHQEAVRLDSASFRGQAGLGLLLLRLGRAADAIPHLRAAASIDRSSLETRKALGAALLQQGRRDEALVALREARQLDSSDSDIERSLKQAEATAPGKDRLNDGTAIVDHPVGRAIRRGLEWTFGVVLVTASLVMIVPLLWGVVLALVRRPPARREVTA